MAATAPSARYPVGSSTHDTREAVHRVERSLGTVENAPGIDTQAEAANEAHAEGRRILWMSTC